MNAPSRPFSFLRGRRVSMRLVWCQGRQMANNTNWPERENGSTRPWNSQSSVLHRRGKTQTTNRCLPIVSVQCYFISHVECLGCGIRSWRWSRYRTCRPTRFQVVVFFRIECITVRLLSRKIVRFKCRWYPPSEVQCDFLTCLTVFWSRVAISSLTDLLTF